MKAELMLLAMALPLCGAAGLLLLRRQPNLREAATLVAGVALAALVISLWPFVDERPRLELWTWMPGLSFAFEMEPLGLLFASVAGCLWPVTSVYAIGYMRAAEEKNQTRFYFCFAIAIFAAMVIAFAGNGLTLFVGYEVLTLATWPLVAHKGTPEARKGARVYLITLLVTSIGLLLPALVWTYALTGTLEFRDGGILAGHASPQVLGVLYALFLFGIGKAALMPFHRWLPSAMVAPTPVSALLHAVAVVKAGVFTVMKITIYFFGMDAMRFSAVGQPMAWVAAFTIVVAAIIAIRQDNLKARLAYSTVSQLSYIVLGAALASQDALIEGALHIVTHAAGKITLFFCAGAIYVAAHKTKVSELDGLGPQMPFTFAAFTLAGMSIIGLPPLAGSWDKLLLMEGAVEAGTPVMMGVLLVSSLLGIAYLMPIPIRAFFMPERGAPAAADDPSGEARTARTRKIREAPWACVVPLCLTALACFFLFFFEDQLVEPLAHRLGYGWRLE
ncbi:MAG: proton-conducting transporter membrane subunit [Sinimarinibacterium flocculans]|uniref:proton-conducting transporter transmembrane domain-containing protein n=1 Tax=Sinimarinibacterium flocculans TaxID=985250 RepID=UPI003C481515